VSAGVITADRRDNLNAIRLSMALLVIYSHSFAVAGVPQPEIIDWSLGTFAVHVFFAVSGYLVAGSYMRNPHFVTFGVNRALRILPGLVVAKIFGKTLYAYFDQYSTNPTPFTPNNSLWTIPWEIACYGACGFAGLIGLLHFGRYNVLFTVIWLMVFMQAGSIGDAYTLILPLLLSFLAGGFVAVNESRIDMRVCAGIGALVLVIIAVDQHVGLLMRALYFIPSMSKPLLVDLELLPKILGTAFCAIYLGKYAPPFWVVRQDYSYGMYLYAWPFQQATFATAVSCGWHIDPYSLFALAVTLTFCMAAPSWHLIEKPALRLKGWSSWLPSTSRRRSPAL
jgi:peptidoglycan/LPS O-acetylase OafA/YrhL